MKIKIIFKFLIPLLVLFFLSFNFCQALEPGTLLYRTSSAGKMYGYTDDPLLYTEKGIVKNVYSGHVGIYIGKEDGEDYIVEALANGVVKTKAEYFVNEGAGEIFLGAKFPKDSSPLQRAKAVALAKNLANNNLKYDFDFKDQKGPGNGEWTCVGVAEKIYESANTGNPNNLGTLEYDQNYYAVDITPDGFNNYSTINDNGDCFSRDKEFSKIAKQKNLLIPAPELIGFDAGLEYGGERYIFLPYTQFLQNSLSDEVVDIEISSNFSDNDIRGKTPVVGLVLRWSLINNPISSIKKIASEVKEIALNLKDKIFGDNLETKLVLSNEDSSSSTIKKSSTTSKKSTTSETKKIAKQETSAAIKALYPGQKINKSDGSQSSQTKKINELDSVISKNNSNQETKQSNSETEIAKTQIINEASSNKINLKDIYAVASTVKNNNPVSSSNTNNSATNSNTSSSQTTSNSSSNTSSSSSGSGSSSSSSQNTNTNSNDNETSETDYPKLALINKVYSTGNNDWIELFNPTDYDFDLNIAGYRLEKAKSAEDPSLIMRIGNIEDGFYPKGTTIKAKGKYLIVRDDANDYYKNKADAIATRDDFSWMASGYTIYLGTAALSSSNDEDIVDAVGFGPEATYFQGSAPAPAIDDNYILNRIDASGNNANDYNLILTDDPSAIIEEENTETEEEEEEEGGGGGVETEEEEGEGEENTEENNETSQTDNDSSTTDTNEDINIDNPFLFNPQEPLISNGISHFWHFDECSGEGRYIPGRFDCAREIGHTYKKISENLSPQIDSNNFSMSFYYKKSMRSPRLIVKLENEEGKNINITLEEPFYQIEGLPNSKWRYLYNLFEDENWHQVVLTINSEGGYWSLYLDGDEKTKQTFIESLPNNFSKLEVSGDMGSVLFDELTIWNRPLESNEILNNFNSSRQYAPIISRENQKAAELTYFWDFNEGDELVNEDDNSKAYDSINNKIINHYADSWIWRKQNNTGIINKWQKDLHVSLNKLNNSKDLSLAFWWRSDIAPREGRSLISLDYNDKNMLGLAADYYNQYFYFNNNSGIFSQGTKKNIPADGLWHHLALTYDSYRYLLRFYVDGEEKNSWPFIWIKDGEEPDELNIKSEMNNIELDDLGIWQGTLNELEIQEIYNNSK